MNLLKTIMKHDEEDCYFRIREFDDITIEQVKPICSVKIDICNEVGYSMGGYNLFGLSTIGCVLYNSVSCNRKLDPPIDVSRGDRYLIIDGVDDVC